MDINILNKPTNFILNEEFIDMPFHFNVDGLFEKVLSLLAENGENDKQKEIIENSSAVFDMLSSIGNTYEGEVFEAALIYILLKYCNLPVERLKKEFNSYSINAALIIKNEKIDDVFKNKEYPYISKIVIADLVFEIGKEPNDETLQKLARNIITEYKQTTQKGLMKKLIAILDGGEDDGKQ